MFKFVILIFCFTGQSFAQQKITDDLKLNVNYHFGYVLPEYQFINYYVNDYIHSIGVSLFKERSGKNYWEEIYNYPEHGFSFFYTSLGNDSVFGKEAALTYDVKFFYVSTKKFKVFNRLGIGIGYASKKFDIKTNYVNVAVGSHFNIHFNFRLGGSYKLSDKSEFNISASFDHFSNANSGEPNLGMNLLTFSSGLSYRLGAKSDKKRYELKPHKAKNTFYAFANMGGKHTRSLSTKKYITFSTSFQAKRSFSRMIQLGAGLDLFYDSSIKDQLISNDKTYKSSYSFQTGFHISQTLVYNNIWLTLQEGIYIGLLEKVDNYKLYNKLIVGYNIGEHLVINLAMKSHLHILDYPEIGVGYKF